MLEQHQERALRERLLGEVREVARAEAQAAAAQQVGAALRTMPTPVPAAQNVARLEAIERQLAALGEPPLPPPPGMSRADTEALLETWFKAFVPEMVKLLGEKVSLAELGAVDARVNELASRPSPEPGMSELAARSLLDQRLKTWCEEIVPSMLASMDEKVAPVQRTLEGTLSQVSAEARKVVAVSEASLAAAHQLLRSAAHNFAHGKGGVLIAGKGGAMEDAFKQSKE